jgi:hypothetical protein
MAGCVMEPLSAEVFQAIDVCMLAFLLPDLTPSLQALKYSKDSRTGFVSLMLKPGRMRPEIECKLMSKIRQ